VPEEKQSFELSETQLASQAASAALRDKRIVPEGVVPKQAQGYVVAGLAVLILLAVMFSKNHAKTVPGAPPNPAPFSNDANARRIAELEQNLSAEQRQSQQQVQQQIQKVSSTAATPTNPAATQAGGAAAPAAQSPPATEPPRDPVADAEHVIAFRSRFASNLVSADAGAPRPPGSAADATDAIVRSRVNDDATTTGSANSQQSPAASEQKRAPEVSVNAAHGQPYVLFEGTTIDTTLLNRLDGDFAGPVKVMVTNPIYSHDNQHVLIPEGTFLLGDVQKVSGLGQRRLAVTFHRMIMPDGYSIDLDRFHGLNQAGETALSDRINNHYVEVFGTSIALGVVAGAAEATTNSGFNESGSDSIRQGMASSLSASAAHVLDRFINILPTITINEGHRVKVYLTQDLLLPAYENHSIPADI
jgi:type IV secretion system protein VirB10